MPAMRIVTWNVWGRYGPWEDRGPRVLETLQELRPDVVCLQEVWREGELTHADVIAEHLGMHAVYSATRMPDPEPGSGVDQLGMAVLGRWPVIRSRTSALPKAADSEPEEHAPTALVVTFDHPEGALHVTTTVPDWEQERSAARVAQTRAVAALLADPDLDGPLPVVLAADLNARPGTEEFQALTDVLSDTWALAGADDEQFTFASRNRHVDAGEWLADGRIDHILFRPGNRSQHVLVDGVRLAGTEDPPGSDHYAVVADLRWQNA